MRSLVLNFSESEDLGKKLSSILNLERYSIESKIFPDGEVYIRLPVSPENRKVIIIQRLYPEPNINFIKLLLTVDACRDLNAEEIVVILPYLAYSRQDKRFREGEAVSLKTILKTLKDLGVKSIITIDVHKPQAYSLEGLNCINIEPFDEYARYIESNIGDCVILSPDYGSLWRAESTAKRLNVLYDYFEKTRDRITGEVTIRPKQIDVQNRDVVIIDDIIATGGTIVKAIDILKSLGVRNVHVIATHGLFIDNADVKIIKAGASSITCTNTVINKYSKIDITELIAKKLRQIIT
ncbi:MAG: ribose-phosphate pyrophosphokinase [Thermoprotei archaeon ex4572_64]|nr:MAG: ribose-phosphate pyrophosphokinase [Thermoprotei archaeon ex4572_64]